MAQRFCSVVVAAFFWALRVVSESGVAAAETTCAALAGDMRCSACEHFVDGYYASALATAFKKGKKGPQSVSVAKVYKERIAAVYEDYAPDKVDGVDSLLKRARGKEHELYARICAKYGTPAEPPYEAADAADAELDAKRDALRDALRDTVAALQSKQWAQSTGADGVTRFVDFQKAVSGGSISASISMGPDVTTKMQACYESLIADHEELLVARLAAVKRPFDSKLHKTFCANVGYCAGASTDAGGEGDGDASGGVPENYFEL